MSRKLYFTSVFTMLSAITITMLFATIPDETNSIGYKSVFGQVLEPESNTSTSTVFSESSSVKEMGEFVADRHGGQGK
ncbi:MAG: hypothetical protein MRJ93_12175 [Nitrososphaeraceae archaeon]|nr:hypothetical protein [Nitrososphaeraceae archaeon]